MKFIFDQFNHLMLLFDVFLFVLIVSLVFLFVSLLSPSFSSRFSEEYPNALDDLVSAASRWCL